MMFDIEGFDPPVPARRLTDEECRRLMPADQSLVQYISAQVEPEPRKQLYSSQP
jgi:hypothetical protein